MQTNIVSQLKVSNLDMFEDKLSALFKAFKKAVLTDSTVKYTPIKLDVDNSDNVYSQGYIQLMHGNREVLKYSIKDSNTLRFEISENQTDIEAISKANDMSVSSLKTIVDTVFTEKELQQLTQFLKERALSLMKLVDQVDYKSIRSIKIESEDDARKCDTLYATYLPNTDEFLICYNSSSVARLAILNSLAMLLRSPILKDYLDTSNVIKQGRLIDHFDILVMYFTMYMFLHELGHIQYVHVVRSANRISDSIGGTYWKQAGMDNILEDLYINNRLNIRIGGMKYSGKLLSEQFSMADTLANLKINNIDLSFGISGWLSMQYFFNKDIYDAPNKFYSNLTNTFTIDDASLKEFKRFIKQSDKDQQFLLYSLNSKCEDYSYINFVGPYSKLVKVLSNLDRPITKRYLKYAPPGGGGSSGNSGGRPEDSDTIQIGGGNNSGGSNNNDNVVKMPPITLGKIIPGGTLMGVDPLNPNDSNNITNSIVIYDGNQN